MIPDVTFAQKYFFWLLLILPVMTGIYIFFQKKRQTNITFSSFENFTGYKPTFRQRLKHIPFVLWCLAAASIIVALARPQSTS